MTSWCPENSAKRGRGQGRREQAALNTGFRRYDGVRCGVRTRHAGSLPRRGTRPEFEGGWRAEKRKILIARALRHTGAFRRANHGVFRQRPLLSSGPSRIECADRSVSQLLAGTPSGPGGSSNAARVPSCEKARRRRTSSRLTTPHETPLTGRGAWRRELYGDRSPHSRHPGASRDPGATYTERAALDTGFRRHDGVRWSRRVANPGYDGPVSSDTPISARAGAFSA